MEVHVKGGCQPRRKWCDEGLRASKVPGKTPSKISQSRGNATTRGNLAGRTARQAYDFEDVKEGAVAKRCTAILLLVLSVSGLAAQQSEGPAPSTGESKSNPPAKKPDQKPEASQPNTAPPEEPPTSTQAPMSDTVAANTPEKTEKKTSPDWLVWFTGALVLVGACQLIAMLVQAKWMRRTVGVAQDSADAANATVKTMQDTAERELRAYVLATTGQRHRDATRKDASSVKIVIKNFGATPAYELTNWMGVDIFRWPLPTDLGTPENTDRNRSMSILGPGDTSELGGPLNTLLTAEQEAQIRRGEYAMVLWGEIKYRDAFNIRRVTRFRYFCIGELIVDGRFAPHDEGNEAT